MKLSKLRLARLQKDLTLDQIFLMTEGRVTQARLSRIERGISKPTQGEVEVLAIILGVSADVVDSVPTWKSEMHNEIAVAVTA